MITILQPKLKRLNKTLNLNNSKSKRNNPFKRKLLSKKPNRKIIRMIWCNNLLTRMLNKNLLNNNTKRLLILSLMAQLGDLTSRTQTLLPKQGIQLPRLTNNNITTMKRMMDKWMKFKIVQREQLMVGNNM